MRLIDGPTYESPVADVAVSLPPRWGGRYGVIVRGEVLAKGWCSHRNLYRIVEAIAAVASRLAQEPGFGAEAVSLSKLLELLETQVQSR